MLGLGLLRSGLHVHVGVALSVLPRRRHRTAAVCVCGEGHDDEARGRRRRRPLLLLHLGLHEVNPGVDLLAQLAVDLGRARFNFVLFRGGGGLDSVGDPERGELRVDLLGSAHRRLDDLLVSEAAHRRRDAAPEPDCGRGRPAVAVVVALCAARRVRLGRGALVAALGRRQRARLAAGGTVTGGAVLAQLTRGAVRLRVDRHGGHCEGVGGGTGFRVLDDYLQTEEQRGGPTKANKSKAKEQNQE